MKEELCRTRLIDSTIDEYLSAFGAVCIEGAKWIGKTWTSSYHSKSLVYIGDPSKNFQNRKLAEMSPDLVLNGEPPLLIDEWQEVPSLWDAVRYKVDKTGMPGQFILTGSSTPPNYKGVLHSGAGRIATLKMYPMSLFESGDSSGTISLKEVCNGNMKDTYSGDVELYHLIELIVRGGWPASLNIPIQQSQLIASKYIEAIINSDAHRIDGIKYDISKMRLLLRSLARNESTTASVRVLCKDIKDIDDETLDIKTVSSYLDVFGRLFLIDNQNPFSLGVKSSVRVKQAEKRHLVDPSLACALLDTIPDMLLNDLDTLGFLFESLCERDLRIYAESFNAKLYHYQDYKNRKIDAVIQLNDGRWSAFEIKLGANQIDKAAENLLKLKDEIMPEDKKPTALCVICGLANAAYKRPDGVFVIPITSLRN